MTGLVPSGGARGDERLGHGSTWSVKTPGNVITLATNAAGGPGATLATLDTTTLPNGSYIIDVTGTDDHGNQQDNEYLLGLGAAPSDFETLVRALSEHRNAATADMCRSCLRSQYPGLWAPEAH